MTFQCSQSPRMVLLACFNGEQHIGEQVASLLSQKPSSPRIIIGDDSSTDGTLGVIASLESTSVIEVIQYQRSSGGAGQSFLRLMRDADLTQVEFLAFCDQDDVWDEDKLVRATLALDEQRGDGYSSAVTAFWPGGREMVLGQNPKQTDLDFLFEGAGQGCTFVLRGEFARQVQQFVRANRELLGNIHYHDWLIYAASRALGRRWVFDPLPSMRYRQHRGNDTGARGVLPGARRRLALINSGWYANQVNEIISAISALSTSKGVIPTDFLEVWKLQRGLSRRLRLAAMLVSRGRRRFSDRVVLAVSALMGWL